MLGKWFSLLYIGLTGALFLWFTVTTCAKALQGPLVITPGQLDGWEAAGTAAVFFLPVVVCAELFVAKLRTPPA